MRSRPEARRFRNCLANKMISLGDMPTRGLYQPPDLRAKFHNHGCAVFKFGES